MLAGFPLAGRRPGGFGECQADHAAVNLAAAGDLPDGHAAGLRRRGESSPDKRSIPEVSTT